MRSLLSIVLCWPLLAGADLPRIETWAHATEFERLGPEPADYLLGLGALQKVGGRWRHKRSESVVGELTRVTWQIDEGYTSGEAYGWLLTRLPAGAEELFACRGRSCGSSAQWADRVFRRRVLYGHDERQNYSVWRWSDGERTWFAVLYAVDRANRRHYVHLDLISTID